MSLKYTLFGIPDNLEEFIDKLTRKDITTAIVRVGRECYPEFNYYIRLPPEIHEYITVEADKYLFKLHDKEHSVTYESGLGDYFLRERHLQRASLDVAKRLEQSGLDVTIGYNNGIWNSYRFYRNRNLTIEEAETIHHDIPRD